MMTKTWNQTTELELPTGELELPTKEPESPTRTLEVVDDLNSENAKSPVDHDTEYRGFARRGGKKKVRHYDLVFDTTPNARNKKYHRRNKYHYVKLIQNQKLCKNHLLRLEMRAIP